MNRESIDKKYQWDLSKIYEGVDELEKISLL
jgi:oligoendopeptidase F